jgi:hypothetical protein
MWDVVLSFHYRFGSCLTKKPEFSTLKMENTLFVGQTKIDLRGIPRHPKGHVRVRYGLVPTNYAMIRVKSSKFDLKGMQPLTW